MDSAIANLRNCNASKDLDKARAAARAKAIATGRAQVLMPARPGCRHSVMGLHNLSAAVQGAVMHDGYGTIFMPDGSTR